MPSCHHCIFNANADGTFTANEELTIMDKHIVFENINGNFEGSIMNANFFGDNMSMKMNILDSDYENYMIAHGCFDNMQVGDAKTEDEMVHVLTVAILAKDPNVTDEKAKTYE